MKEPSALSLLLCNDATPGLADTAGDCEDCSDPDCTDPNCEGSVMKARKAEELALLKSFAMELKSIAGDSL
jgi:hypothetical protein